MAVAADEVIVGESRRLHQGLAGRAADETETVLREELRQGIGLRGARGQAISGAVARLARAAADDRPQEPGQRSAGPVQREEGPRVGNDALDLSSMANDRRIRDETLDAARVEARDALRIESGERPPVPVALRQDRAPGEPRLGAFERQEFEQRVLVGRGNTPLAIMVVALQRAAFAPWAAGTCGFFAHRGMIRLCA